MYSTVGYLQLAKVHIQFSCGHLSQEFTRGRCGFAQLGSHVRDRSAAKRAHVVRSKGSIAHYHLNGFNWNGQFLRDNLGERRADVLSYFYFTRVYRYLIVFTNVDPCVNAVVVRRGNVDTLVRQCVTRDECHSNPSAQVAKELSPVHGKPVQRWPLEFVLFRCNHSQVVLTDRIARTIRG